MHGNEDYYYAGQLRANFSIAASNTAFIAVINDFDMLEYPHYSDDVDGGPGAPPGMLETFIYGQTIIVGSLIDGSVSTVVSCQYDNPIHIKRIEDEDRTGKDESALFNVRIAVSDSHFVYKNSICPGQEGIHAGENSSRKVTYDSPSDTGSKFAKFPISGHFLAYLNSSDDLQEIDLTTNSVVTSVKAQPGKGTEYFLEPEGRLFYASGDKSCYDQEFPSYDVKPCALSPHWQDPGDPTVKDVFPLVANTYIGQGEAARIYEFPDWYKNDVRNHFYISGNYLMYFRYDGQNAQPAIVESVRAGLFEAVNIFTGQKKLLAADVPSNFPVDIQYTNGKEVAYSHTTCYAHTAVYMLTTEALDDVAVHNRLSSGCPAKLLTKKAQVSRSLKVKIKVTCERGCASSELAMVCQRHQHDPKKDPGGGDENIQYYEANKDLNLMPNRVGYVYFDHVADPSFAYSGWLVKRLAKGRKVRCYIRQFTSGIQNNIIGNVTLSR